jgi:hypothetical protein
MLQTIIRHKIILILIICISVLSTKSNGQVIPEILKSELIPSSFESNHHIIGENQNGLYYSIRAGNLVDLRIYNSKLEQKQLKQFKFPIKTSESSLQFESFIVTDTSIYLIAYESSRVKTSSITQYYSLKLHNQTLEISGEKKLLCQFDENFTHGLFFWPLSYGEQQHYNFDEPFFLNNTLCSPNKKYFAICLRKNKINPSTEHTYRFIVFNSECNKEWDKNITYTTINEKTRIKNINIDDDKCINISVLDTEDITTSTKNNNFYYINIKNDGEQVSSSTITISGKFIFSAKHTYSINKIDYVVGIYGEDSHSSASGIFTVNLTEQKYPETPSVELSSLTDKFLNREIILNPTKKPIGYNILEKFKFHIESIYFDRSQNMYLSFERFKVQKEDPGSITCYNLGITIIQLDSIGKIISTKNISRDYYHWTASSCSYKSIQLGTSIYYIYNELIIPDLSNSRTVRNNEMNLIVTKYNMGSKSISKSVLSDQDPKNLIIFNPFYTYYQGNSKLLFYGIGIRPYPKNQLIQINFE